MRQERRRSERAVRKSIKQNTRSVEDECMLQDTCRSINYHMSIAKTDHYCRKLEEAGRDQRELSKITKNLLGDSGASPMPSSNSSLELAEYFSEFLVSKIVKIRDQLQDNNSRCPPLSPTLQRRWEPEFGGTPLQSFAPATEEEVAQIIKSAPSNSCELDPVSTSVIKQCIDEITPLVTCLVNASLLQAEVPENMKTAIVRPLLKRSYLDQETFKNYRPHSNLSFVSKVLEKVVAKRLD